MTDQIQPLLQAAESGRALLDATDAVLLLLDHQAGLFQTVTGPLTELPGWLQEVDAGNAISAAVAVQHQMRHINEELREMGLPEVHIRIGIHKGVATVGINGSDRGSEYMVIGDPVNVAARLEAQSQPGAILLSDVTAGAAEGNSVADTSSRRYDGKRADGNQFASLRWIGNPKANSGSGNQSEGWGIWLSHFPARGGEYSLRDHEGHRTGQTIPASQSDQHNE